MSTIAQHIGALRTLIKETSDDSNLKDPFIYHLLKNARAYILTQELNKKGKLNEWNQQNFCIKMELSDYSPCDCVPNTGCKVLKSTQQIPRPLANKWASILKVTTIDGYPELYPSSPLKEKLNRRSKTRHNKLGWDIVNNYLVVFIKDKEVAFPPKVLMLSGVFEDPLALTALTACDTSGEETGAACYNLTDEYPMEEKFTGLCYEIVLKYLGIHMPLPEDRKNDAQSPTAAVK